jgi:DNA-binding NtrC family response regulator
MESYMILLVDDDQDILDSVGDVLRHNAFRVKTAKSVPEAKAVLVGGKVDVIVADLELGPDGSGDVLLDCAARQFPSTRRILYSSKLPANASAHVFIDKPNIETLIRLIRAMALVRRSGRARS